MTFKALKESAEDRVRLLDIAVEALKPGDPEFDSMTGRYDEAKVFLSLVNRVTEVTA